MKRWRGWLRWLAKRRAATAVVFALTITPILGFVALAVDVGSVVWARARLDLAADAAALTAVVTGANDVAANPDTSLVPAQDAGAQRFNAQAGALPGVNVTSVSVGVTRDGATIRAAVNYTAEYTTQFASLFGFPTLPASGMATASRTNSPYFAIDIMMDASSSMAIAATESGMEQLGALVQASPLYAAWGQGQNCAFGCHFDAGGNDFYGLARANEVPLRIDVLIQAVRDVITTIAGSPSALQFSFGLYSFNTSFNTIFPPSADLAAAQTAAGAMTVPVTTDGGDADTDIPLAMRTVTGLIPPSGDGSTPAAPRRFLFIVTDGVADYCSAGQAPGGGCVGGNTVGTTNASPRVITALDPTECAALKANGVTIMTLYTTYFPLIAPYEAPAGNAFYDAYVAPFVPNIQANLTACASSPTYAFVASDAASIGAALQAMLQAALAAPARFTQ